MDVSAETHPHPALLDAALLPAPLRGSKDSQQVWRLSLAPGPSTLMPGRSHRLSVLCLQADTLHSNLFLMANTSLADSREPLNKCVFGALRVFCARNSLLKLEIRQVFLRFRAFSGAESLAKSLSTI